MSRRLNDQPDATAGLLGLSLSGRKATAPRATGVDADDHCPLATRARGEAGRPSPPTGEAKPTETAKCAERTQVGSIHAMSTRCYQNSGLANSEGNLAT
jgi:hypothetical protein